MAENTQSSVTEKSNNLGRPKADIEWKKVDELLIAGCSGTEIAGYFGITPGTLYDRCLTDNRKMFSDYSQEKQSKGDSILRAHQYAKALGLTEKGDNTLLIWLGKTRLKQKEHVEEQITSTELNEKFDSLMNIMGKNQDRKIDEINSKAEVKS